MHGSGSVLQCAATIDKNRQPKESERFGGSVCMGRSGSTYVELSKNQQQTIS